MAASGPTVEQHFTGKDPKVRELYHRLLKAAAKFGTCVEDPKKTSIHLNRRTAFAGIATRKDAIILTLKAGSDIRSARVSKREKTSAHRWHHEVRLTKLSDIDAELLSWLKDAYELSA